jgi:ureidoglycolate dehydrogenase (NAD+)
MSQDVILIKKADLSAFVTAIFVAAGVSPAHAEQWTAMLIWANLRGVDSHGVIRMPRYLDLLRRKSINAAPNMRIERKTGAVVVLEADRAPGAVAMTRAMAEAIDRAREVHIGW